MVKAVSYCRPTQRGTGPATNVFGRYPYYHRANIFDMLQSVLQCPQPHGWIETVTSKYSGTVHILDAKVLPDGAVQHLFDIQVRPELVGDLLDELGRDKDLIEIETIKSKSGHVYGFATSQRCTVCKEVAKSRCFVSSVEATSEGARWTIIGNDDAFGGLLTALDANEIAFEVILKRSLENTELLTARQEQILSVALERGYFDFPKKIGLEELAAVAEIKPATLAEILRRAQKKILSKYLDRRSLLHESKD